METLHIYTSAFFLSGRLKAGLKRILRYPLSGPKAVIDGLLAGLRENGAPFALNQIPASPCKWASVIEGINTLKWAIARKQAGLFEKIIAGPLIGVPLDNRSLLFHPAVDALVLSSQWSKEFVLSFGAVPPERVKVWAAGVGTLPQNLINPARQGCLVYYKNKSPEILRGVEEALRSKRVPFEVLTYGKFQHQTYIKKLCEYRFLVYLSDSESQGLALNEAWMCDAPTLVYNGGHMRFKRLEWRGSSPAPYLTKDCGLFFSGVEDFGGKLEAFLAKLKEFHPRRTHLNSFTHSLAARKYLSLLQQI